MLIVEHRVNWIDSGLTNLIDVPSDHGVEIDIRHDSENDRLYLSHEPLSGEALRCADSLDEYLSAFSQQHHPLVVFNIKEAGIEKRCAEMATRFNISPDQYFFLDVEFPFIYAATRGTRADGFTTRSIAIRYSEAEAIEMTIPHQKLVDWVWIDTNTRLPIDTTNIHHLSQFKTCLVSPDRWRPKEALIEIPRYKNELNRLGFQLDAVMVGKEYAHLWK